MTLDQRLRLLVLRFEYDLAVTFAKVSFKALTDRRHYSRKGQKWGEYQRQCEFARCQYHADTKHPLVALVSAQKENQ